MWRSKNLYIYKKYTRAGLALLIVGVLLLISLPHSSADTLLQRQLIMSNSTIGASASYKLQFDFPAAALYGSLQIEICSNDPLPGTPCTIPGGLDLTGATLTSQTGVAGFIIAPGSTSNKLLLSRVPAVVAAGTTSYTFDNIINPSSPGSYFVRLQTYPSADGSGPRNYIGGAVFATTNGISVTAKVPPYITFCTGIVIHDLNCATATGDYIDFGELSFKKTSSASSQMIASTNALNGYNLSLQGTTMASGTNQINALPLNDVSRPATSQFGLNLTANSTPAGGANVIGPGTTQPVSNYSTANSYRFASGETLASNTKPDEVRLYTVSYIVNVPKAQAPGIYVTTITYICLGSF